MSPTVRTVVTHDQLVRFGRIMFERRTQLGMTRDEVHAAGGPSDTTLARIEKPSLDTAPPRPKTLRLLDAGLKLVPGNAALTLAGGNLQGIEELHADEQLPEPEPELATKPSMPSHADEADPLTFRRVSVDVSVVQRLIAASEQCLAFLDRADLPESARSAARAAKHELGTATGSLAAAHATEVLERAGGPGRDLPLTIELAYRSFLAEPASATGPERNEQLYRRWLAGRAHDLEPERAHEFARRWRAKLDSIHLQEGAGP